MSRGAGETGWEHPSLVSAALAYARRGWPVVPLFEPGPEGRGCACSRPECSSPAKHPRIQGGLKKATTDEEQIQAWWSQWPTANVGVRTGADSGLVVLDIDPDKGGDESLAQLEKVHGALPTTEVVKTGSGGRHLYFEHPGGKVSNRIGLRPGLDVRADGGYVVAPPSLHVSGHHYRWAEGVGK